MGDQIRAKRNAITDGNFTVSREHAWECAYAVHLLSEQIIESPINRAEDLEIFAEWAQGDINIQTLKRRLETGEA